MITAIAMCLALAAPQDQLDEKIKSLITSLKSDDIETREKATQELMNLEVAALPTLEKAQAAAEGEVRARLELAITRIRREVKLLKKAPPIRLITVSAKNQPLKDFLPEIGRQAGVSCECDPAVAAFTVTLEAKDEPLLKVLDRACRTRADVTFEIAQGKVRMVPGEHPEFPTAYAGAFRARLMKVAASDADDSALYFRFDAQPDQPHLSATGSGAAPAEGVTIRPASQVPMTTWRMDSLTGLTVQFDDVSVPMNKEDDLGALFLVRSDKGGRPTLGALRIRVRFLFDVDSTPAELPLLEKGRKLAVGDYSCNFRGPRFFVHREEASPQILRPSLGELIDLTSFVVTDAAGEKFRLVSKGQRTSFPYEPTYEFLSEKEWKGNAVKLEYKVYTLAEREVEFELKDVKLRD